MNGLRPAKKSLLKALCRTSLPDFFRSFTRGAVPIFTLHRFADPEHGVAGHDPLILRKHLSWLRREGYRVLPLAEVIRKLREEPEAVTRSVAITVDDGYEDFYRIGWPVLAEFDCPVTVFLTSAFADRKMWFWWDRIEYALSQADCLECTLELGGHVETFTWTEPRPNANTLVPLVERLKDVSESVRLSALEQIERLSPVPIPTCAPPRYAPLRWEHVRLLGERGVTFGPHGVTHSVLARTEDGQSEREILESWDRIQAETSAAVPVFCYPNGRLVDFGIREMNVLHRLGFAAALATNDGFAMGRHFISALPLARFALPRYPWPEAHEGLVQIVSGMERAKQHLRARAAWRTA